jgi:hypothetical protein
MSSRSFRSVFMVASCAGAALGCYLVSLRVASERAQLEDVETKIVLAQRDMRVLQTEIGTRGRLSQLERWNAGAFALSAPAADQLLKGGFELARLQAPQHEPDFKAPVVLASAPAPAKQPALAAPETDDSGAPAVTSAPATAGNLLHVASYKIETREVPARKAAAMPQAAANSADRPALAAKPAHKSSVEQLDLAAAHPFTKAKLKEQVKLASLSTKIPPKKSVDKELVVTAKALTKPVRLAKADPLAPLQGHHSGHSKAIATER